MVTGGKQTDSLTSVEILHGNGTYLCTLKDLPLLTYFHTQINGNSTVCGGAINGTSETCQSFKSGNWTTSPPLYSKRTNAVSWKTHPTLKSPSIIMGGYHNPTTAEILVDGHSVPLTSNLTYPIDRFKYKPYLSIYIYPLYF